MVSRRRDPNMQTKVSAGRYDDGILYKNKTKDILFWNDSTTCDVIKVVIKMEDVKRSKVTTTDGRAGIYAGQPGVVQGKISAGHKVQHKEVRDAGNHRDGILFISKGYSSSYPIEIGFLYTIIVYSKSRNDKSNEWSKRHSTKAINDTWKEFRFLDKHAKNYERINSSSSTSTSKVTSGRKVSSNKKPTSSRNKKVAVQQRRRK